MKVEDPAELAKYLKSKKNVLLLTGFLCDEVEFNGEKLMDYAAQIAHKLNVPVAATANTIWGLKERNVKSVKKMWLAEVINYMRYPWEDSVSPAKPELLIFIGYPPAVAQKYVSAVRNADTLVLGNAYIDEATYSLPNANFREWREFLRQLIQALGSS